MNKWDSNLYPATSRYCSCHGVNVTEEKNIEDWIIITINNLVCPNITYRFYENVTLEKSVHLLKILTANDLIEIELEKIVSCTRETSYVFIRNEDGVEVRLKFKNVIEATNSMLKIQLIIQNLKSYDCDGNPLNP